MAYVISTLSQQDNLTAFKRSMHFAAQGHQIPPPHIPAQSAPYAHPYSSADERFERPLMTAFPTSPPHARKSPSPSEETHHADGKSDPQIELDDSRQHNFPPGPSCGSGEVGAANE